MLRHRPLSVDSLCHAMLHDDLLATESTCEVASSIGHTQFSGQGIMAGAALIKEAMYSGS